MPAFASICRQTAVNYSLAWLLSMKHGSVNSAIVNAANKPLSWAAEVDTRRLKLQVIPDTEQDSIELFLETWVARGSRLITDAHASYNGVEWLGYSREAYNHSTGHFGMSNHIECIWSAMKRHLRKLYGCVPTRYLVVFLREWEARHNQRELFESPGIPKSYDCDGLVEGINKSIR